MRFAIAVVMFLVLFSIGIGMLRSLGARRPHEPAGPPEPPPPGVRVTFWCENCGTEVLLLRQGTESPPRHCGEQMLRREEVARS